VLDWEAVGRIAECTVVKVTDAHLSESLGRLRLRQPRLAAQRSQAHIDEHLDVSFDELGERSPRKAEAPAPA
jgi:hypothetical protein